MPDGQHFIYLRAGNDPNTAGIYPGSIDMKPPDPLPQRILPSSLGVVFVATDEPAGGRLLYLRDGTLMAQPFDVKKLALVGEPVPVAEKVGSAGAGGYFTASASGALAYRTGEGQTRRLSWFDRTGKRLNEVGDAAFYDQLALSHDGTRAATHIEAGQRDVWVFDLARNSNTRLTFDPSSDDDPVWSPDGSQIAYCSGGGNSTIQRQAANGTGEPEVLIQNKSTACPQDWSRDGKYLLYSTLGGGAGGTDLWVLPPRLFLSLTRSLRSKAPWPCNALRVEVTSQIVEGCAVTQAQSAQAPPRIGKHYATDYFLSDGTRRMSWRIASTTCSVWVVGAKCPARSIGVICLMGA
jgi:hypothetical protein